MDFNCFTWIFCLVLAYELRFDQSHPPTPHHISLIAPFVGSIMSMQGGDVTTKQIHPWQLWDEGAKGYLWVWNRKLVMWGR
jgi:hypothetical protein